MEGNAFKLCFFSALVLMLLQTGSALPDEVLELADRLLEQGSYNEAVTEYKRFIFFNPESDQNSYTLYKMGLAYRARQNWQEAVDAFKASVLTAEDARAAGERGIILATTLIANGNYSLAKYQLLEISEFTKYPLLRLKALYFGGIASLYMFDWNAAEEAFDSFYSEYGEGRVTERAEEIRQILGEAKRSHRSTTLARLFSTVIPGLGQIYAGDWRDGLNALALNSLTIGFFIYSIYRKEFENAGIIFPISMRYYTGNIYRARVDVGKYNRSIDRQNAWKVLSLVSEDEPLWGQDE